MNVKKLVFAICLLISFADASWAQDYNFGIRAGLNFSTFLGPERSTATFEDSFGFNNGLHFAITYAYNLTDKFGFASELAYSQIGSKYTYNGDSYYIFQFQNTRTPKLGHAERVFDINNSYISIPAVVSYKPTSKWEFQAGGYVQFLVIPRASSTLVFRSPNEEKEPYSFSQSSIANYYSDEAAGTVDFAGSVNVCLEIENIGDEECPLDQILTMPNVVGGYYEFEAPEKTGSLYNWFDAGLTGSVSYFFNGSLYARLTAQYGLMDITNNSMDVDYSGLNASDRFIFQDHKDVNLNLGVSLGFKF